MRKRFLSWDTVVTAAVTSAIVLAGWIYTSGRMSGQTGEKMEALKVEQASQKQRIDKLEADIASQLSMLSDGQALLIRNMEVLRAEQQILHRDQLWKLEKR